MQHYWLKGCLNYLMKTSAIFHSFITIGVIAIMVASCSKSSVSPANSENDGFGKDVDYDSSYPVAGDWVLQYADGGIDNSHTEYPQDGSFTFPGGSSAISWASHLSLLTNDSAYWNSWGFDALPMWFSGGTYSLSRDDNYHPAITLSFTINNDSIFEYSFKGKDTLVLNDYTSTPTFSTYMRK